MADDDGRTFRGQIVLFVLGIAVLTYVGGAFSANFEVFPYPQLLERPFRALSAWSERKRNVASEKIHTTAIWQRARYPDKTGVDRKDERSFGEYTVFSSGDRQGASLIDSDGEVVHTWRAAFREVWPDHPHVDNPVPEPYLFWRRVHLFADGDVIASYSAQHDAPYGYGLVRVDRDSNVVWKYGGRIHHDFTVRDDGSIVALGHRSRDPSSEPVEGVPQLDEPFLSDYLVVLSPEGKERRKISLIDALVDSAFRGVVDMLPKFLGEAPRWDPLHTNTANVIGEGFAEHYEFAEPGQVMVSFRELDTVAIVDLQKEVVVWASRGFWSGPHDPDPLPNGDVLVFDNRSHGGPGGGGGSYATLRSPTD
ncbi:MAG: arylsulfotransferase family protein [Bradymonadaceae bacterium]